MWLQLFVFHSSNIFSDEMLLPFFSQALSEPQGVAASIIFLLICGMRRKKKGASQPEKLEILSKIIRKEYQNIQKSKAAAS